MVTDLPPQFHQSEQIIYELLASSFPKR